MKMQLNRLSPEPRCGLMFSLFAVFLVGCMDSAGDNGSDEDDNGQDQNGSSASAEMPMIKEVSATGAPLSPQGQIELDVVAESPSGNALNYRWHIPEGWDGDDSGDSVIVLTAPDDTDAKGRARVVVSDGELSRTAFIDVSVDSEMAEQWSVSIPDDEPLVENDSMELSVSGYSPSRAAPDYHHALGNKNVLRAGASHDWVFDELPAVGGVFSIASFVDHYLAGAGVDVAVHGVSAWPTLSGNRQRTGLTISASASQAEGSIAWESDDLKRYLSGFGPTLGPDNRLYIPAYEYDADDEKTYGYLHALNTADGTEEWSKKFDSSLESSAVAVAADGTAYVGARDGRLYALDPADGTIKWDEEHLHDGTYESVTPMIAADGTIYVVNMFGILKAINPEDGSETWSYSSGSAYTTPALGPDGTIYFASHSIDGGSLYAISPEEDPDERVLWEFTVDERIDSSPTVGMDGTIYVGSDDEHFYAINPDGTEKWSTHVDRRFRGSAVLGPDGTVYIGVSGLQGRLHALDPADGTPLWTQDYDSSLGSYPAVGSDGTIYMRVGSDLTALNPADGTIEWTVPEGDGDPIIDWDGTLYVVGQDRDGKIYAIE